MRRAEEAIGIMRAEAQAIEAACSEIDWQTFVRVVDIISRVKKLVLVSGMGKVGHVGERFAATLSSTGTPACFLHPAEAAHGDLGIVSGGNLLVALSNSGKTREVLEMIAGAKGLSPSLPILVITGNRHSPLYKAGMFSLCYGKVKEPCPLGLTPTASIAVLSALLDALTLCVMRRKGFTAEDYSCNHHGGYLGKRSRAEARLMYGTASGRSLDKPKEKGERYGTTGS